MDNFLSFKDQLLLQRWRAEKESGLQKLERLHSAGPVDSTYIFVFRLLAFTCSSLVYAIKCNVKIEPPFEFNMFQSSYLVAYFLVQCWDSIQWPYFYNHFVSIGYERESVVCLAAAYFLGAGIFAPVAGLFAEKWGRKKVSIHVGLLAIVSFVLFSIEGYSFQWWSRFVSGMAMAIAVATFEPWLVSEHNVKRFRNDFLYGTFFSAYFGASLVGLLCSAFDNYVVQGLHGLLGSTFQIAVIPGILASISVLFLWREHKDTEQPPIKNYNLIKIFVHSVAKIFLNRSIFCLLLLETVCHVPLLVMPLLWAPTVIDDGRQFPLGLIFSNMTLCSMIGSALSYMLLTPGNIQQQVFKLSAVMATAATALTTLSRTQEISFQLISLCLFYLCGGVLAPFMARLRSIYIQDEGRSVVYGILKAPAFIIVYFLVEKGESTFTLVVCATLFSIGTAAVGVASACMQQNILPIDKT